MRVSQMRVCSLEALTISWAKAARTDTVLCASFSFNEASTFSAKSTSVPKSVATSGGAGHSMLEKKLIFCLPSVVLSLASALL